MHIYTQAHMCNTWETQLANPSGKINGYKLVLPSGTLKSAGVCGPNVFLKTHEQYQICGPPTVVYKGSSKDMQSGQEANTSHRWKQGSHQVRAGRTEGTEERKTQSKGTRTWQQNLQELPTAVRTRSDGTSARWVWVTGSSSISRSGLILPLEVHFLPLLPCEGLSFSLRLRLRRGMSIEHSRGKGQPAPPCDDVNSLSFRERKSTQRLQNRVLKIPLSPKALLTSVIP